MPWSDAALAAVLKRDRAIIAACLVVLIMFAWAYIVWLADDMEMGGMDMTVGRQAAALHQPFAASAFLAGGYLSAWIVFSFAATIAQ